MPSVSSALNIEDLRVLAKKRLTKGLFEFCDRGSEDDVALRAHSNSQRADRSRARA